MRPSHVNRKIYWHYFKAILKLSRFINLKSIIKLRNSLYKHIFEKVYTPYWTAEVFKILFKLFKIQTFTYLIGDYKGNPMKINFYKSEQQKTKHLDTFLIGKILERETCTC